MTKQEKVSYEDYAKAVHSGHNLAKEHLIMDDLVEKKLSKQEEIREGVEARFREAGLTTTDARNFAQVTLKDLDSQGVVLKADRGLPSIFDANEGVISALEYVNKLKGYVAVESLVEGGN